MIPRKGKQYKTIYGILFVIFVELYSVFTTFVFAPALANVVDSWIWISTLALFLLAAHFAGCYLLRNENPLVWLVGIPINIIFVCIFANINDPYFVRSLGLYGIISKYSNEKDLLLTYIPYYFDSIIFSILIAAGRVSFAAPTYYIVKVNKIGLDNKV